METYIMTITDESTWSHPQVKHIRINEKQKKLIDFLCDDFNLVDAFDQNDITINIVAEEEGGIIDFA